MVGYFCIHFRWVLWDSLITCLVIVSLFSTAKTQIDVLVALNIIVDSVAESLDDLLMLFPD